MPAEAPSLAQLRDLHLPPEAGFWPLAPGWWLLLGLIVLLVLVLVLVLRRYLRHRRGQRYRRQALQLLQQLSQQDSAPTQSYKQTYLQQLNALLKRVAQAAYPQAETAGLYGEAWCRFLRDSSGLAAFTEGTGRALASGPYQPDPEVDVPALQKLAEDWIRQHRAELSPAAVLAASSASREIDQEQQGRSVTGGERPC